MAEEGLSEPQIRSYLKEVQEVIDPNPEGVAQGLKKVFWHGYPTPQALHGDPKEIEAMATETQAKIEALQEAAYKWIEGKRPEKVNCLDFLDVFYEGSDDAKNPLLCVLQRQHCKDKKREATPMFKCAMIDCYAGTPKLDQRSFVDWQYCISGFFLQLKACKVGDIRLLVHSDSEEEDEADEEDEEEEKGNKRQKMQD